MTISVFKAAKRICELGNWKVTNLQLQKVLYLAEIVYLGRNNGTPLIDSDFEAWSYGPVNPELYKATKMFGAGPIKDFFYGMEDLDRNSPENKHLEDAWDKLGNVASWRLVSATHRNNGAWAKHYKSKCYGIKIPKEDMYEEYKMVNERGRKTEAA